MRITMSDTAAATRHVLLEHGTAGWARAWDGLAAQGWIVPEDGPACPACHEGECWQYMGTHYFPGGDVGHEFRHRSYPGRPGDRAGRRVYATVYD